MAKLLDLSVYGPGHISNILQVDASVYAMAFVTDGGKNTQVVRGDGTLASISSLSVGNADTLDSKHAADFAPAGHVHTSVNDISSGAATTFAYSKTGLGYDSYTWIAAWNGYELRAVSKTQFSISGHTHDYITSLGDKNAEDLPSTYPKGLSTNGIYYGGYPFNYGCGITAVDTHEGAFQIAGQWNEAVSSLTDNDKSTEMYIRGRRDNFDVWTTWTRVITNRNYTSFVNTTNFPGLHKVGTVTSVTVTGSNGLSGTGTITTSGTITLSNAGVRSTTINGNYLRVNTNGTNADLTIPYATYADTLDGYHYNSFAWAVHSHEEITNSGKFTAIEGTTLGNTNTLRLNQVYGNGYPVSYGNVLRIGGVGYGELLCEWTGTTSGTLGRLYYRSKRDVDETPWSAWGTVAYTSDIPIVTNYYWANVRISAESNSATNPTFATATAGKFVANNASGPHFTGTSTAGNWAYLRLNNSSYDWDIATRSNSGSGGLWLSRFKGLDNGIFVSAEDVPKVGINTSTPGHPLTVSSTNTTAISIKETGRAEASMAFTGNDSNAWIVGKGVGGNSYANTFGWYTNKVLTYIETDGTINTIGNIFIGASKGLIQKQADTSNYTSAVKWYKGGVSTGSYVPQIGQHNTGGTEGTGSICILPYTTETSPWGSAVGLWLSKTHIYFEGNTVLHEGNYASILDNRYYTETESDNRFVNITGDTMTGKLHITTSSQTMSLGSSNSSWGHIETTAPNFYFNKSLYISGSCVPYENNSYTSGSSTNRWSNVYSVLGNFSGAVSFANGTWNPVGDDTAIGDCNLAGLLGLKSLNNNLPGVAFYNSAGTNIGKLLSDNSVLKWNGNVVWHAGNDGTGTGLDADLLDGLHQSSFTREYSFSMSDYGKYVIGLLKLDSYDDSRKAFGRIYLARTNTLYTTAYIDYCIGTAYSSYNMRGTIICHGRSYSPCTFTYNGILYGGIILAASDAQEIAFVQKYNSYGIEPFVVRYYDTRSGATNTEVNNSLSTSTKVEINNDIYGHLIGNISGSAASVRDTGNGTAITFSYSTGGFSSNPSWIGAWNGYNLTYVSPSVLNVNYASSAGNADTVDNLHASDFVRAYGTYGTSYSIDSDWGQSIATFDPVCGGTYPLSTPNSTILNLGNNYARRKQLFFDYNTNNIYFRRRVDSSWKAWVRIALVSDIPTIPTSLPANGGNADTVDNKHASDFATAGHTHNLGNKAASDLSSTYPDGISVGGIYNNGYPFTYGCTMTACGNGGYFQIAGQWNSSVTGASNYDFPTEMYIRGRRDSYDVWTTWSRVLTNRNYSSFALPLSGGTCTGNIYAPAFYESSDERLKDFENNVDVDLNVIRSIPKRYFRWKKNPNELQIGTSAQAVKQIYPELVTSSDDGMLSVDYSKLSIVALSAIDKLHLENKDLRREINILKQEIEKLKGQK